MTLKNNVILDESIRDRVGGIIKMRWSNFTKTHTLPTLAMLSQLDILSHEKRMFLFG